MAVGYNSDAPPEGALHAKVAELVDAQDLGSCGATRESSSLSFRTSFPHEPETYRASGLFDFWNG